MVKAMYGELNHTYYTTTVKQDCRLAGKLCMKSGCLLMFTCVGCKNSACMQNCKWISRRWIKEGKNERRVSPNRSDEPMLQHSDSVMSPVHQCYL